ncbi:hypothetical protein WOLCODRAFT_156486 [Wolfiporia cocos MD-104 SS10]|uniref:Uncharacterized protein n=1 Tax=Wolfiporia cocos (strain MD-104) TaxID=742152 RepID=A0A2H3JAK9_WOLCO|nr:hypothetical protein WOLCODRAFT_156486 [Wolfiporia cocos MD-104 SS10]
MWAFLNFNHHHTDQGGGCWPSSFLPSPSPLLQQARVGLQHLDHWCLATTLRPSSPPLRLLRGRPFWVPCGPPHNPGLLCPTHNRFTRHDLVWPHSTSSTQPPLPIAQGRVRAAACGNSRLATRLALVAGTQGVPLHSNLTLTLPIGKPPSQQVPWANAGVRI